jgi:hypothetical protein
MKAIGHALGHGNARHRAARDIVRVKHREVGARRHRVPGKAHQVAIVFALGIASRCEGRFAEPKAFARVVSDSAAFLQIVLGKSSKVWLL